MADPKQLAEDIAAELNLPVSDVAKVLRAEHRSIQARVAAGERVVLTGFAAFERTADGRGAKFTPGTTFRRVLRGEDVVQPISAPAVQVSEPTQMARRIASKVPAKKTAKAPAKKAPSPKKAPAKKARAPKKATVAATTKPATATKAVKKAPAKKTAKAPTKKATAPKKATTSAATKKPRAKKTAAK